MRTANLFQHYDTFIHTFIHKYMHTQFHVKLDFHDNTRRQLLRIMWRRLCIVRAGLVKKSRAVSSHFARFLPMKKGFQGWRIALQRERRRVDRRTLAVSRQGDKCVLRFCWARWQGYMEEARFEHRVNSRADLTWATVQTWLRK